MEQFSLRKTLIGIFVVFTFIFVFGFVFGCERINTGHIGLRENLTGGEKGLSKIEYVSGLQFYNKLSVRVHELSIRQQPAEYEPFTIQAKGGTIFTVHPAFNFSLNAGEAAAALSKIGANLEEPKETFIKTALRSALREATNTFTVDSILNNVGLYDAAVTEQLNENLAPYFTVSQFTSGLEPDEALKKAIAAKSLAVQEAIQIEQEQRKIKAQVENDLLLASRDSAVKVRAALAEAKSISVKQAALQQSPQYVELTKAEKWDGKLPTYMLGSGQGMFLNIGK